MVGHILISVPSNKQSKAFIVGHILISVLTWLDNLESLPKIKDNLSERDVQIDGYRDLSFSFSCKILNQGCLDIVRALMVRIHRRYYSSQHLNNSNRCFVGILSNSKRTHSLNDILTILIQNYMWQTLDFDSFVLRYVTAANVIFDFGEAFDIYPAN